MTTKNLDSFILDWSENAELFVREALGVELITKQQQRALTEITKLVNARIKKKYAPSSCTNEDLEYCKKMGLSIMAAKGLGKSAFESWVTLWFLCCFSNSKVPSTAPTSHHLKDVLWSEIRKWIKAGDIANNGLLSKLVDWQGTTVKQVDGNGFASARTCATNGTPDEQAETLAGRHEDFMLINIDEASGVPEAVFRPLETTMTGFCNIVVMSFNPTRTTGYALDTHTKHKEHWITLHWDAEDCPELVSQDHIERMRKKYGPNSNMYRINVKGLPPKAEENVLIPLDWVLNAVNREDVNWNKDMAIIGSSDIGAGSDITTLGFRQGFKLLEPILTYDNADTMRTAEWLAGHIHNERPKYFLSDMVGVGQGVHDRLREFDLPSQIIGFKGSNKPRDSERFDYIIDELWWKLRELFEKGLISIPDDDELITELTNRRYSILPTGKIKLETKREMKSRGIRSPNKADMLAQSFYIQDDLYDATNKSDKYTRGKNKVQERIGGDLGWMAN